MNPNWRKLFFVVLIFGEKSHSSCENGIINQLFGEDNTLIYVLNDSYYRTNNPKYIFATHTTVYGRRIGNISDYILQARDEFNLLGQMNILQNTSLWDPKKSPKRRFLIFVNNITTPQAIFDFTKKNYLINVLIIHFLFAKTFTVYYPETYCNGTKYTRKTFTCDELNQVNFQRNANILRGCELDILVATALPTQYIEYNNSKDVGFLIRPLFFLEQMYDWKMRLTTRSVAFQFQMHENIIKDLNGSDVFACDIRLSITDDFRESTKTIFYENFLWLVPIPKKKSNVKVLVMIYNYSTWALIIATFFFVTLLNFIIDVLQNHRRDFQRSFFEILRLNFGFGINQLSKSLFYRIFIMSYIIYCLHVNCFYQGKLSAVLTSANYEHHIRNVENLYESNLRLLVPNFTRIRWNKSSNALVKKFANKAEIYLTNLEPDADFVNKEGNIAVLTKSLKTSSKDLQLVEYFSDSLRLTTEYAYALLNGSYYIPLFTNMIRITNENGFLTKWINDVHQHYHLPKLNNNATLTLKHLMGAFIILFTGLVVGFIIFIAEIVAFKLKKKAIVENIIE